MTVRRVRRASGPLDATLAAPASKSVTHRALVAAALGHGPSLLRHPLDAADTRVTRDGLRALGIEIDVDAAGWRVHGGGGEIAGGGRLELRESGTSSRLLTAVAALGRRASRLDGSARLRERPLDELVAALARLGAMIRTAPGGGLPLETGGSLPVGGRVALAGERSSQFASALLLIGPRLAGGLELELSPRAVSLPYVEVTARVLGEFGVVVERPGPRRWRVAGQSWPGREHRIEGDHSSASSFLAAAAVVGGRVRVEGLDPASAQPDARLGRLLERLGCSVRRGEEWIEVEGCGRIPAFHESLTDAPDLAPTMAVLALFADGPCRIDGVAHLRLKESDRLEMLAHNLVRLGRPARAGDEWLEIGPPASLRAGLVETAGDHRLVMAFAVAGLRLDGVAVEAAEAVAKSNPDFWSQLERLRTARDRDQ